MVGQTLAEYLDANTGLTKTELNLSNHATYYKEDGPEFARELAVWLRANGALTSLNLSANKLTRIEHDLVHDVSGVFAIADAIKHHRTLVKCDISRNNLYAEGGKALAGALKDNRIMKELNISSNHLVRNSSKKNDFSALIVLSYAISTMEALTSLNVSNNELGILATDDGWNWITPGRHGWRYSHLARGRDQRDKPSNEEFQAEGVIALADAIIANGPLTSLNISSNLIHGAEAGKALGNAVASNTVLTELDLSNQGEYNCLFKLDVAFVKEFAMGLGANGTLTSLNISTNSIGNAEWQDSINHPGEYYNTVEREWYKQLPEGAKVGQTTGVVALASAISTNRTLVKFDISGNNLCATGGKAVVEGLKNNHIMTELNLADNHLGGVDDVCGAVADLSGILAISDAIPTMETLMKFDISNNYLRAEGGKALAKALKNNKVMQELNIANNLLIVKADINFSPPWQSRIATTPETDIAGVIAIRNAISTMQAIVSVNILGNRIGIKQGEAFVTILETHPTLKSICGNKGNETVLNMKDSKKTMDAEGVIMLVPEIITNERLTRLSIRHYDYGGHFGDIVTAIKTNAIVHVRLVIRLDCEEEKYDTIFIDKTNDLRQFLNVSLNVRTSFTTKFSLSDDLFEEIANML